MRRVSSTRHYLRHGRIQPVMLGGAKPPISGHRSGPKPRGPGFLRGEASPSHQLKGLGERCIDLSSSSGAPAEPRPRKGLLVFYRGVRQPLPELVGGQVSGRGGIWPPQIRVWFAIVLLCTLGVFALGSPTTGARVAVGWALPVRPRFAGSSTIRHTTRRFGLF